MKEEKDKLWLSFEAQVSSYSAVNSQQDSH